MLRSNFSREIKTYGVKCWEREGRGYAVHHLLLLYKSIFYISRYEIKEQMMKKEESIIGYSTRSPPTSPVMVYSSLGSSLLSPL